MYKDYFGFTTLPFASAPDPNVFYLNAVYETALDRLKHGLTTKKGLVLLTGPVGTGKTALLRKLFHDFGPTIKPIWIVNSKVSIQSILNAILADLYVSADSSDIGALIEKLHDALQRHAQEGRIISLVIEEAQNLDEETLEGLRELSNFEAHGEKLLQIILVGPTQLIAKLDEPENQPLKQRIALHCRLFGLTRTELERYINFHLQAAGHQGANQFGAEAVARIAHYSGGIPRLVNFLCDNALLSAYRHSQREISAAIIDQVADDIGLAVEKPAPRLKREWQQAPEPFADPIVSGLHPEIDPIMNPIDARSEHGAGRTFAIALIALIAVGGAALALYSADGVTFPLFKPQRAIRQNDPEPSLNTELANSGTAARLESGRQSKEPERAPEFEPAIPAPQPPLPPKESSREVSENAPPVSARQQSVKERTDATQAVKTDVQKAIQNRAIQGVSVRVVSGTVYLHGRVASERQKELAEIAALSAGDGMRVENRITVESD